MGPSFWFFRDLGALCSHVSVCCNCGLSTRRIVVVWCIAVDHVILLLYNCPLLTVVALASGQACAGRERHKKVYKRCLARRAPSQVLSRQSVFTQLSSCIQYCFPLCAGQSVIVCFGPSGLVFAFGPLGLRGPRWRRHWDPCGEGWVAVWHPHQALLREAGGRLGYRKPILFHYILNVRDRFGVGTLGPVNGPNY